MEITTLSQRLPNGEEKEAAAAAVMVLTEMSAQAAPVRVPVNNIGGTQAIDLPPAVSQAVIEFLGHIACGEMVTIVPYGAELTTQQAADLLNVSRPYLISLLDAGDIPHFKVGTHRRIRAQDLLEYKEQRDEKRAGALKKLQQLGQEFEAG